MVPGLKDLPFYLNKLNEIMIKKYISYGQANRWL